MLYLKKGIMDTILSKLSSAEPWFKNILILIACVVIGLFVQWIFFTILRLRNQRKSTVLRKQLLKHLKTPTKFFLPLLFIYSSITFLELGVFWQKIIEALIVIHFAWISIAFLNALEEVVKQKFHINGSHRAKERKVLTQLRFMKSVAIVVIITITIAAILWNIPAARKIGTTILTSAGVIGIIAGVAAQKSLANLITGFQIAFAQPIKIDDKVVIKGEFGIVEDITLTYVVVKTWDWRRLVIPLSYFNENSFVNWTFNSTELVGSVFLYVDYTFPVAELRKELLVILNQNPLWDKNIVDLLVTNTDTRTMELRATFSAKNASDVWDLRCKIREQLIEFIQDKYPTYLPKLRRSDV